MLVKPRPSGRLPFLSSSRRRVLLVVAGVFGVLGYLVALLPRYPGEPSALITFAVVAAAFAVTAAMARSSYFIITLAAFLTLGFPVKLILHLVAGVPLLEPVGGFDNSAEAWDSAIAFSSSGLLGCWLASLIAVIFRSRSPKAIGLDRHNRRHLMFLCAVVAVGALGAYALNAAFDVIRIGYPPKVILPWVAPALLSFVIAWGAVLAALCLTWWLAAAGKLHGSVLIYVALAVGIPATLTMGSRVQLLLYVLAASFSVMALPGNSPIRNLINARTAVAMVAAAIAIAGTLFAVNLQRDVAFSSPPAVDPPTIVAVQELAPSTEVLPPAAADVAPAQAPVSAQDAGRVNRVLAVVAQLVSMRWLGLEGAMAAAGSRDMLDTDLFLRALRENPAAGMDSIYQHIAGDPYAGVTHYSFLTIPGLVGFVSLSGSLWLVVAFCFLIVVGGHVVEVALSWLVGNAGAAAVVGVSLAYLIMQLNFPWTLAAYVVELLAALTAIAIVRWWMVGKPSQAAVEPHA